MVWAAIEEAAPAGWWLMETTWRQDGAMLANGLQERGLKEASGKEAEAVVNCWHALATVAAGMTRGDIIRALSS